MDNKSYDKLIIMQATIESNKRDYHEKINKLTSDLTGMITPMMDQIKTSKFSTDKKDSPKTQYTTTA